MSTDLGSETSRPAPSRPYVSILIIAASCIAFLNSHAVLAGLGIPGTLSSTGIYPWGALYGPWVQKGQWWRILTMVIEHGGILHIVLNMSVVYTLGFSLERNIGHFRFAVISGVTAMGASGFALLLAFHQLTVGASGMILGWAGAMLCITSAQGRRGLWVWLAQVALISFLPGVSWQGHLGGFLFGLPCGLALRQGAGRFQVLAPFLIFSAAAFALFAGFHPIR